MRDGSYSLLVVEQWLIFSAFNSIANAMKGLGRFFKKEYFGMSSVLVARGHEHFFLYLNILEMRVSLDIPHFTN